MISSEQEAKIETRLKIIDELFNNVIKLIHKDVKNGDELKQLILKSDYTDVISVPDWIAKLEEQIV